MVRNENRDGVNYEHNIGLNLVPEVCTQNINYEILQKVDKNTCKSELKEYEQLIPSSVVRPLCKEILFDPQRTLSSLFKVEENLFQLAPSPLVVNKIVQHSKLSVGYTLNTHMLLFTISA